MLASNRVLCACGNWLKEHAFPLRLFFVTRFALLLIMFIGLKYMPMNPKTGELFSDITSETGHLLPDNLVLDGLTRWDAVWYAHIIKNGYTNQANEHGKDTAFFPLYPLLSRVFMPLTGNPYTAGILVANLCFLASLLILDKLFRAQYGKSIAHKALTLLAVNPFAFYFSAGYSESLFLLTISAGFYSAYKQKLLPSGIFFALASVTRVVGGAGVISFIMLYGQKKHWQWKKLYKGIVAVGIIGSSGLIAFLGYQQYKYNDMFQFLHSQDAWGSLNPVSILINEFTNKIRTYSFLDGNFPVIPGMHLFLMFAAIALLIYKRKEIGYPYVVFSLICIAMSFTRFTSMGRFLIVQSPVFVGLAMCLRKEWLYQAALYVSITLLALFAVMFSHFYWVA